MFREIGPMEIILILAVLVLLFGAKKLPELARGSGRALRIFKAETKGLMDDDEAKPGTPVELPNAEQPSAEQSNAEQSSAQQRPAAPNADSTIHARVEGEPQHRPEHR